MTDSCFIQRLSSITTPAAVVHVSRMTRNIQRMQSRMDQLGVRFRPHVKTTKCLDVVQAQIRAGAKGITVSTLKEAEQFFAAGITDILYAVGMVVSKLPLAMALCKKGCDLKLLVDNVDSAKAIGELGRQHDIQFKVYIEIDTDQHRSGVSPEDDNLLHIAKIIKDYDLTLEGVLTHAGSSYEFNSPEDLKRISEVERSGCVRAAQRLRSAGYICPEVSIGSTPTALSAEQLIDVTEVRAGVYVFFDLVMSNVGVCSVDDISLSILTTVIGHQPEKGWAIVDAGWMAMSRDRGTQKQVKDYGYGQVCQLNGEPIDGYLLSSANQEHGIVSFQGAVDKEIVHRFPVGSQLLILPNHACATGAQYPAYQAVEADGSSQTWPRFYGW